MGGRRYFCPRLSLAVCDKYRIDSYEGSEKEKIEGRKETGHVSIIPVQVSGTVFR